MSIESQIKAAWKEESPKVRESLQCSRASQVLGAAEIGFTAGYLAALRSLYVDISASEAERCGFEDVFIQNKDGEWFPATGVSPTGSFYAFCLEDSKKVRVPEGDMNRLVLQNLPCPSDIFGRGE